MHCIANLTDILFFALARGTGWRGGGGGGVGVGRKHCCTVWQETKLNHEFSINTDSLNCNLFPRSIQCERTSFLASFDSSVGKKNISYLVAEGQMFKEQGEMAVFTGYVLMCYSFFEHSKRIFYGDSIKFQNQYL